ncbi:MAG: NAD(P)H-binding protein [Gemmatimonadaceae bacterium]|nr:NAD(P)H-binding protein [Gemmatimonadaceae bacterium]
MIIALFGASGRLGQCVIESATAAGHTLRLHYRAKPSENVPEFSTVVVGRLDDPTAVREVLRGADAAVVVLGHKPDARVPYIADATKLVVSTMKTLGQSRLLVVTGAMVGHEKGPVGIGMRLLSMVVRSRTADGMMEDRDEQERRVKASHLDGWTVIKPPRLSDGPVGDVDAGATQGVGLRSSVSRKALAKFIVQELEAPQFSQQVVYVAGR